MRTRITIEFDSDDSAVDDLQALQCDDFSVADLVILKDDCNVVMTAEQVS